MITLEPIAEILKNRNGEITEVEIDPQGYMRGRLANKVDPARPYLLIIHPMIERLILRVCVLRITRVHPGGRLVRALADVNPKLPCGCVGLDDNDEVLYQINHVCTGGDDDPPAAVLERLLDETMRAVRGIEKTSLFYSMLDAGVPRTRAEGMMQTLFPKDKEQELDSEANETL